MIVCYHSDNVHNGLVKSTLAAGKNTPILVPFMSNIVRQMEILLNTFPELHISYFSVFGSYFAVVLF